MERLFDSVAENTEDIEAHVKGQLPKWLSGHLFRLGPGKYDFGDFTVNHWFDGCALLYRFSILDGKVIFKSRFLETNEYERMAIVERPVFTEFGTKCYPDPCKNIFSRYFSQLVPIAEMTDNTMAGMYTLGDELYCASETCFIWKVDPQSLKAVEKVDITKMVTVNMASSHPHYDADGTLYNLGGSLTTSLKYNIVQIRPQDLCKGFKAHKKASVISTIPSSWNTCISYYHSFGMSENYFIFLEQPLLVNTVKLAASGVKGYSVKDCFDWSPKEKTRFHVIEKNSGHVLKTRYIADAMFVFHHINAYEEENQIIVDLVAFDNAEILDKFYLETMRAGLFDHTNPPQPRRYVIPLNTKTKKGENLVTLINTTATAIKQDNGEVFLTSDALCTPGFELPSVNPSYNAKKHRYIYGSGVFEKGVFHNCVCKLDVDTRDIKFWRELDTMYPSEVTFLAKPGAVDEDDGILLTVVVDVRQDFPDFLLVLDAKTFQEIARAEVQPDVRIHHTIHGHFQKQERRDL